jgi:hypothetical protein
MRFLLQILGLLVIVLIGWNQPFCDVARALLPWAQIPPSRLSVIKARSNAAGGNQAGRPGQPGQPGDPGFPYVTPKPKFAPVTSMTPKVRP